MVLPGRFAMTALSRRSLLAGTALGVAAASLGQPARAAAPTAGKQAPAFYRYKVGTYELAAVNDGVWNRPLDDKFVKNAPFAEVQKALADSFMPTDKLGIPFTTLVVNT